MPGSAASRSESRTQLVETRSKARAIEIQRARERSSTNNGSSPILRGPDATTVAGEGEQRVAEMDEDVKAMVKSINDRMSSLPTRDQFAAFATGIEQNRKQIEKTAAKVEDQATDISKLRDVMERVEREQVDARRGFDAKVRGIIDRIPTSGNTSNSNTDDEFNRARKSMRIWPLEGNNEGELVNSVRTFLTGALEFDSVDDEIGHFSVKRARPTGAESVIYSEAIVEFKDNFTRDVVAMRGSKLSGYVDSSRKPTCGMRLEVPEHLTPAFRILKRYGFSVKKQNPSAKHHVKFNDYDKNIYIQVRIDIGEEWMSFNADEAQDQLKRAEKKKNSRTRSLLSPDESTRNSKKRKTSEPVNMEVSTGEEDAEVFVVSPTKTWKPAPRKKT